MRDFEFQNKTRVVFGKNAQERTGELTAQMGKKVLLHYGGGSIKKSGLYDQVIQSLRDSHVEVFELSGVKPNPRLSLVQQGIEICRKEGIEAILAVGGGSVIDSAKAIGVGVPYQGDVWDFYNGKGEPKEMMPLGVILTLPAAGSETSFSSVVTNEEGPYKRGLTHPCLRPEFALLNPELTYTLPDFQTACGISDMLAHVMERYFSDAQDVELTDQMCEAVMRTIIHQAYRVMSDPEDYSARAEIMWAGTMAHNDILDTGRGGDWGSHAIEHEISALYDVAHGAGLAVVFPAWMKLVHQSDIPRFARFARQVFGIEYNDWDPGETAWKGIEALEQFYLDMGLPIRLSQWDIKEEDLPVMAKRATMNDSTKLGEICPLGEDDVLNVLKLAR